MQEPLDVAVEGRVVSMTLTGTLNDSNFETLKGQIEAAKKSVQHAADEAGGKVGILFNLTPFTGVYNVGAMLAFKDLEAHNRPYTSKTAVFGGSMAAQVAAELTLELIGRDNLKLFKTEEEGRAWLGA